MENVDKENPMELTLTGIHAEDGYAYLSERILGKQFLASLTLTSTGHPGWYTIVGVFKDKLGIDILDNATQEKPTVITMAQYTL